MGPIELGESGPLIVRAFFGLPVPEAHRRLLAGYLEQCSALAPEFRWTPSPNLHLTVRFLGQVELPVAEGIAARLEAQPLIGFDLELGDVGTFKRGRLARVVWLGLRSGAEGAASLAELVEAECVAAELKVEERKFNAHLTLARARPREGAVLPTLPQTPSLSPWRAHELILYRSHLGRAGSVYEPLRRLRLS